MVAVEAWTRPGALSCCRWMRGTGWTGPSRSAGDRDLRVCGGTQTCSPPGGWSASAPNRNGDPGLCMSARKSMSCWTTCPTHTFFFFFFFFF
ncbi:hypothetical protein ACRAWD_21280 [Caulobacter segnis]